MCPGHQRSAVAFTFAATLTDSTVSDNEAVDSGGGISNSRELTLTNSTVSGNTADDYGGGIGNNVGTASLKNTIVANNTAAIDNDCTGMINSNGYNLDSDGTCNLTGPGDLPNTNPNLGPLADNGGSTQNHALLAGSPAIDAGSPDCPPPATDQRGVVRPQGVACDIGAFELKPLVVEVDMDVKPRSDPNSINLSNTGVIPVAILGSYTFDHSRWLRRIMGPIRDVFPDDGYLYSS